MDSSISMDMEEGVEYAHKMHHDRTESMEEGEIENSPNSQPSSVFGMSAGRSDNQSTQYTLGRSDSFTEAMVYTEAAAPRVPLGGFMSAPNMASATPPRRDYSEEDIKSANTPTIQGRFEMDFEVTYTIGNGTFGTVYAAKHKMSHANYAVKRSKRAFTSKMERTNMLKEVEYMAEAQEGGGENGDGDNHIVRYMGAWIEDERVYLQMELCEMSVEAMMHKNRIPFSEVSKICRHMLLALDFIHSKSMCHLDIKPGNILVKAGSYKLSDFGLALHINKQGKVRAGSGSGGSSSVEEGDSRYMPVEMLSWSPVENLTKCDMFSLGISTYEMVVHKPVAAEGDEWQLLRSDHWPAPLDAPDEIVEYMEISMKPRPEKRLTAKECLAKFNCFKSEMEKELAFQKASVQALKDQLSSSVAAKPQLKRHHSVI